MDIRNAIDDGGGGGEKGGRKGGREGEEGKGVWGELASASPFTVIPVPQFNLQYALRKTLLS